MTKEVCHPHKNINTGTVLNHGLTLECINRVIEFEQSTWMKPVLGQKPPGQKHPGHKPPDKNPLDKTPLAKNPPDKTFFSEIL